MVHRQGRRGAIVHAMLVEHVIDVLGLVDGDRSGDAVPCDVHAEEFLDIN
jgi:hypothetical protein